MANGSDGSSLSSWQFMALLAAAMGAFLSSGRLGSPFPSAVEPANDRGTLVNAHLADDPFGAWVRAARKSDSAGDTPEPGVNGSGLPGPLMTAEGFRSLAKDRRVCLLPLIVRGDFHSTEAREMRIRLRAATVSGLGAQGLVADDPDHLLLLSPPKGWSNGPGRKASGIDQPIPAEWFIAGGLPRDRSSPYGAVLVVWVQDETLFINPLRALGALRDDLTQQLLKLPGIEVPRIDFKIIGPYWSGTLKDMIAETEASRGAGPAAGTGMTFYSATATMADGMLDLLVGGKGGEAAQAGARTGDGRSGRERLSQPGNGPVLVNLTCTDEELADALLDELRLRGVDVADPKNRIAIISDWDTEYGRVLPLTFAAKLAQLTGPGNGRGVPGATLLQHLSADEYRKIKFDGEKLWPRQILRAYYISGVGGTASTVGAGSDAGDSAKGGSNSADMQPFARAEGEHQVDYIARLGMAFADRLNERDAPGPDDGKPAGSVPTKLRAIGLMGSNVYDELLLLQSLRPRFPDAVFFTDKLDARFFDPASRKTTRNLVVASTYGFELFQKLQVGVAPFRSSEQTGVFLAVQAAVESERTDADFLRTQLLPLRFEIGRTYPVPLFVRGRVEVPGSADDPRFHNRLHPSFEMPLLPGGPFWRHHAFDIVFVAVGALFFAAMTLFVFVGRFRLEASEMRDAVAAAALAAAVAAVLILFSALYDGVEPLTWIEGVSVWPSEFFRLVALATAAGGLYYCGSRVRRSRRLLCEEFGLIEAPCVLRARSGFFAAFGEVLARMPLSKDDYLLTEREDDAAVAHLGRPAGNYRGAVAAAQAVRRAERAKTDSPQAPRCVSSQVLWRYLCERSTPARRNARAALMTVFYFAGWAGLFYIIGIPQSPTRGAFSVRCDGILLFAGLTAMVYLIFWVVDETQSCLRFVSRLGVDIPSHWPDKAFEKIPSVSKACEPQTGAERRAASSYVDVLFIGRLTAEAVPLIILPFAVLTMLIFARWTLFANWHMSASILAFYGVDAAICALCASLLKNEATKAKLRAIRNIGLSAADAKAAGAGGFADSLQDLQSDMEGNQEGAFLPWHQQPFVRAILLPFGGSGVLQAVEFMMSKQ
ncbi:MAG TPA: hypothetical protein VKG78_07030 [Opitutaceae bacterium]|nr:hypothetical protein [Opitutaceae bacterium]